jgi:histidine triad (HIT) family protein
VSPVSDCIFCAIVGGDAPAAVVREWDDALAIVPLGPVVDGHLLVIPKRHVADASADPDVTAATMRRAAEIVPWPANIITSLGEAATQSVFHLHIHIVPRTADDGLALPWYSGKRSKGHKP